MKVLEYIRDWNNMELLKNQWEEISKSLSGKNAEEIEVEREKQRNREFVELVDKAKKDWKDAQNYFEHVSDPDLIDLAIYRMEASKTFYMYLLKQAKEKGIQAEAIS